MDTINSYNLNFLNNYFTSKEFDFITNADVEKKKLESMASKEINTRDTIVRFINSSKKSIANGSNNIPELDSLLPEVQSIFDKLNENIKLIYGINEEYSSVSAEIVNLLIKIESSQSDKEQFFDEIQALKSKIRKFSNKSQDAKSLIYLNDIKIDTFLQKNIVKKYLSTFDIEVTVPQSFKEEPKISHTSQEKDISNNTLLISEKENKIFLPYTNQEISLYLQQYPDEYHSYEEVIKKEFILPLDYYMKHPVIARFKEAYSLIRDRESKSVIDAFKFAVDIMFHYELNPVIIAACKTQEQLENYMDCLDRNKLDDFKDFNIKFEVSPLA